ncbi:glycosyltransferase family 2 protein [Hydrocarboniphaga sp.]|uniref:glycosyltransferase family 2 protein n=1 Tax=Hydrocarboniphaga sp. TaxID=2033016 RepID=UPI003D125F14
MKAGSPTAPPRALQRIRNRVYRSALLVANTLLTLHWLWPWMGQRREPTPLRLRANGDLQPQAPPQWLATGGDPQFVIANLRQCPRGWVRLSGQCSAGPGGGLPRVYVDSGRGYREERSVAMTYGPDRLTFTAEVRLPLRTLQVRLDPTTRAGAFRIEQLSMQRLGADQQLSRNARAVLRRLAWPLRPILRRLLPRLGLSLQTLRYRAWLRRVEPGGNAHHAAVAAHIGRLAYTPLISIVMPTYNTPLRFLQQAVASVQAQRYPHWQLCIADDASPDAAVRDWLSQAAAADARIRLVFCARNGGIVAASNAALDLAEGDYVGFLDHDDRLAELALYYVAIELNRDPRPEVIYTDEDKIDERGRRFMPHLKPDWNPELLLSNNYIAHFAVYRRTLVEAVGRLRMETEGSQDYDLMLRCTAQCKAEQIRHIPVVLYHWRAIQGSTAREASAKSYTQTAGYRALGHHLRDVQGVSIEDGRYPNMYRLRFALPEPAPRVSIIIPSRDGYAHLSHCLRSLRELTDYPDYELLLVDNQSRDPATLQLFAEQAQLPNTRVLPFDAPFNYSAINNRAARQASGELLLLLNDDIEIIDPGWLTEMVSWMQRPGVAVVGAKLLYPDQTVQHAAVVLGAGGVAGHGHLGYAADSPGYMGRLWQPQRVSAVTAACLLIERAVFEAVGGLDEQNLAVAFNDVDLCLRVTAAGHHIVWTPHACLIHHESKSRGSDDTLQKRERFEREIATMHERWGAQLWSDPYYHPGFSMKLADYSLSAEPVPHWPWLSGRV